MSKWVEQVRVRLARNGRREDVHFALDEELHHRFHPSNFKGKVYQFHLPDMSVNRTKFGGQIDDVLIERWPQFKDWGVLKFTVKQIPTPDPNLGGDAIYYMICHDPTEDNYDHCEIRAFRDHKGTKRIKNYNQKWKLWFRTELSQRVKIVKAPIAQ